MKEWVSGWIPGLTRSVARTEVPGGSAATRPISCTESTTSAPMPAAAAIPTSSADLLLPGKKTRSMGKAAACARCSSPPLTRSRPAPVSATSLAICTVRKALPAYSTRLSPG